MHRWLTNEWTCTMAMQMKYELSDEAIFNANHDHVVRLYLCYLTKHEIINYSFRSSASIKGRKIWLELKSNFFSSIYHSFEGILWDSLDELMVLTWKWKPKFIRLPYDNIYGLNRPYVKDRIMKSYVNSRGRFFTCEVVVMNQSFKLKRWQEKGSLSQFKECINN